MARVLAMGCRHPRESGGPEPAPGINRGQLLQSMGLWIPAFAQGCPGNSNGLLHLDRNQPKVVMRRLDPRIHAVAGAASAFCKDVDGRIKSDQVRP
jgi:hypothetical protein